MVPRVTALGMLKNQLQKVFNIFVQESLTKNEPRFRHTVPGKSSDISVPWYIFCRHSPKLSRE